MEVSTNHLLLQIESNSFMDSIILFISSSSASTKSYPTQDEHYSLQCHKNTNKETENWYEPDNATQNIIDVTPSKQWIHFFLSDLWPPTSNILCHKNNQIN